MMDAVMQVAWTALAVAAVALAAKLRRPRGLWPALAALCVVIAVDKAVDLQTPAYALARETARAALAAIGLADARRAVKAALLVAGTLVALAALVVLLRRSPRATRGERFAVAAFALVAALVGLRFVPGLGWLADPRLGWACEAVACGLLATGLADGFRRCDRTD